MHANLIVVPKPILMNKWTKSTVILNLTQEIIPVLIFTKNASSILITTKWKIIQTETIQIQYQ